MKKKDRYLETLSGAIIHPWDLKQEEIRIDDIANSLAMQPRFNGSIPEFYSIADHSVYVLRMVERMLRIDPVLPDIIRWKIRMQALLHDASELIISDIPSPVKEAFPDLRNLEHSLIEKIYSFYGCNMKNDNEWMFANALIYKADKMVLLGEKEDVTSSKTKWKWAKDWSRCPFPITFTRSWKDSKGSFLREFNFLQVQKNEK